jgi:uncharacterized protein YybS (DUF2232 family)
MPLMGGDRRTLWIIMGAFFIFCLLIVTATELALPVAVIFPAAYFLYAERIPYRWPGLLACAPLLFSLVPAFSFGAMIYAALLVSALMMHYFLKRGSPGLAVAVPSFMIFAFVAASIFSLSYNSGNTIEVLLTRWAAQVVEEMKKVSEGVLSSAELFEFKDNLKTFQVMIVTLFPSIIISSFAAIMWMNLLIITRKFKVISIQEWKSPDWVVAFFILAGLCTLVEQQLLQAIGLNLLVIVGQVYFLQGLAIVSVFMDERKWPGMIRWPIYILILIQIYMMIIVAGFGLFDTWFDFRKRIRTPKGDIQ